MDAWRVIVLDTVGIEKTSEIFNQNLPMICRVCYLPLRPTIRPDLVNTCLLLNVVFADEVSIRGIHGHETDNGCFLDSFLRAPHLKL